MTRVIDVERHGDVHVVRMARGKVNALDLELLHALRETFAGLRDAGAVVLTGVGRAFSAGVDLRRLLDGGSPYTTAFLTALASTFRTVFEHPRPVVAAINGHAIAGGCILAAACDHRLMSAGTIGVSELAVGVPFPLEALEVLRFAVGPAAPGLILTARTLPPSQAMAIGLVDEVVEPDALLNAALHRAGQFAQIPAQTFTMTKAQLRREALRRMDADGPADAAQVQAAWTSPPVREAITAFLNRLATRER